MLPVYVIKNNLTKQIKGRTQSGNKYLYAFKMVLALKKNYNLYTQKKIIINKYVRVLLIGILKNNIFLTGNSDTKNYFLQSATQVCAKVGEEAKGPVEV